MGRDSASSAQSKRAGSGKTAGLGLNLGTLAWMGGEQDTGGECGVLAGADGVVGDAGGVYHVDDTETAHFRGVWGELGGWDTFRGCSAGSSRVFCCSGAVVQGPEWGIAGG